ncbi:SusE domain-containing protein [Dawidia soli]|uniref:SusE domain-containing protein n=1 Tax=Dawidia soli TaxID=2782352 RepID=A0AAP2D7Y0_9BACT|nr:SusE domain-containing protein [Dawidia soli]MBT1687088.1 SusE domain-containing protein [Dawidia soli]
MNTLYKNILASATLLVLIMTVLIGCKDDEGSFNDVTVTSVEQFYEPADDKHITLQSAGSTYFEWEKATAADNSIVYYDVLFDKADGDFTNPVYVVSSDNKGTSTGATVTHKTLNKIAMMAGIELAEEGALKWTVRSSRGLNFNLANESRSIAVIRINSVDDLEGGTLYITGAGSEDGQQVKASGAIGEYDIYTKLEADKPYYFYSTMGSSQRTFVINPDETSFKETLETPEGATVSETGVYHIHLDFGAAAATVEKIDKAEIVVSWTQRRTAFTYKEKGVWELIDYNVQLAAAPWGFDERYKIVFTMANGSEQHWGQKGPHFDDRPSINRPGYRDMAPTEGGQWGGSQFKFPSELADGTDLDKYTVDVTMSLTADKNYTHDFTNVRP